MGGAPPRSAAKTVQTYLSALRRALPAGAIETVSGSYRLAVGPDDVDTARFERLAAVGAAAVVSGDAAAAAGYLKQALSLWRGQALEDLADQPPGTAEAARLEELRRSAEEEQAEAGLALGRHHRLVGELEVLVAKEPFRERRWRLLMLALYRSGRQSDALRAFQRLRAQLGEQLGIDPERRAAGAGGSGVAPKARTGLAWAGRRRRQWRSGQWPRESLPALPPGPTTCPVR